jgi:repressor of nif and glnA expression
MRVRPSWMTESDPVILEMLYKADVYLSPKAIVLNLEDNNQELHRATVQRSLTRLENGDMVRRYEPDSAYRKITDYGRTYLDEAQEMSVQAFLEKYEDL